MATCSSILAWENPGTGESGGLLSMGVAKESDTTERLSTMYKVDTNENLAQGTLLSALW